MRKTNAITTDCEISYTEVWLPLWRETLWGLEWLELRSSPLYRGVGVAQGHGEPVVLVPGFLSQDSHLRELQRWLTRIGYRVQMSGIGRNADCPDVLLEKLVESIESLFGMTAQRIRLIGHSLGGTLASAAAVRRPDLVAQVVTLGSPIREVRAHPLVVGVARLAGRLTPSPSRRPRPHGDHVHNGTCACELMDALGQPFPSTVARTAIFTRKDGVVDWRSTMDEHSKLNIEVDASHLGLPFNTEVYQVVARLLASIDTHDEDLAV